MRASTSIRASKFLLMGVVACALLALGYLAVFVYLPSRGDLADQDMTVEPSLSPLLEGTESSVAPPQVEEPTETADSPRGVLEGADRSEPTQKEVREAPQSVPSAIGAPADEGGSSTWPDDVQTEGLSISGQVLDEDGQAIGGIEVLAKPVRLFEPEQEASDTPAEFQQTHALTAYDGYFVFAGLSDGEYLIRTETMAGFEAAQVTVRAGSSFVNLVLRWRMDVQVHGFVSSNEGLPLEEVKVSTISSPARVTLTDLEGFYELIVSVDKKDMAAGLRFARQGYRTQEQRLEGADLEGLERVELDVFLEAVETLSIVTGSLLDPDGRPIAGESVTLQSAKLQSHYRALSDERGRFSITEVRPGEDYLLFIAPKASYRNYRKSGIEVPARGLDLEIVLDPLDLSRLSGQMMDIDGNPVPRFSLSVKSKLASLWQAQVTGDDDGFFVLEDVPAGEVVFSSRSFPRFVIRVLRSRDDDEEPVPLTLDLGQHDLYGWVTDGRGNPIPASKVTLSWWYNERGVRNFSSRDTTADEEGYFAFTGLGPGEHTLRVTASAYAPSEIDLDIGVSQDEITVELFEE